MIYEPAEDTFLLAKYIKKYAKGRVLDMGSGSGCLAKIALQSTKNTLACDISKDAVKHLKSQKIKTIHSDLFSKIKESFDLIIFNPPYLAKERKEPKDSALMTTGGKKGNEIIIRFLRQAKNHLNKNGKILLLFSSLTPDVLKTAKKLDYRYKKLGQQNLFFERLYVYLLY